MSVTENILRMRVDSTEYDANLRSAAQALGHLSDEAKRSGGILNVLEDEYRGYVDALGEMPTKAKSATGATREMEQALKDLTAVYKRMSQEERRGEFGRALSGQLDVLKGRLREARAAMSETAGELGKAGLIGKDTGGVLKQLAGEVGINVGALTKLGSVVGAAGAALKVARDAFFSSQETLAAWNGVVRQAQGAYEGFLVSLNTGDVSGFLGRIGDVVRAAKDASAAIGQLNATKILNAGAKSEQQAEFQRMRSMLMTGRYIAPDPGTGLKAAMPTGTLLTDAQKRSVERKLESAIETEVKYLRMEAAKTGDAIEKLYKDQAGRLGMSYGEFRAGTRDMGAYQERLEGYRKYRAWEAAHTAHRATLSEFQDRNVRDGSANPWAAYRAWGVFQPGGELNRNITELLTARAGLMQQQYQLAGSGYRNINRVEGITPRIGGGKVNGGSSSPKQEPSVGWSVAPVDTGRLAELTNELKRLRELQGKWSGNFEEFSGWQSRIDAVTSEIQSITKGPVWEKDQAVSGFRNVVEENALRRFDERKKDAGNKDKKNEMSGQEKAEKLLGGVTDIVGGLEQMGVKIPEGMSKMVAVMQGLSAVMQGVQAVGVVLTAVLKLNTATNLLPFHTGGVVRAAGGWAVPGNYGFDAVPALLTSGEVVLNRAQQGNLASQLAESSLQRGMVLESRVSAEDIRLVVRNNLRRMGKGEYVTSRVRG